jgi:hypothetical protein
MEDRRWHTLYRAGAVAPLIALVLYSSQFILLALGDPYPLSAAGWFALAQRSKLLALWTLNALDILSVALLGIMILALHLALRQRRPSWMLIATYMALLGVAVFVVPRALTLAVLPLSDLHAAATTEAQRSMYLMAGETLTHVTSATPMTLGFLFMASAGLIVSLVMLLDRAGDHASPFGRAVAYVGIVGFVAALANYLAALLAPSVANMLTPLNGALWLIWWLLVARGLFKLARSTAA